MYQTELERAGTEKRLDQFLSSSNVPFDSSILLIAKDSSNLIMGKRVLDLNVAYAEGLKDVNLFTKMNVYVIVSIIGGSGSSIKQKTNTDRNSGTHPTWNFSMRFTIDELCALQGRLCLIFNLKCEGSITDSDIGEVRVPIKDLMDSSSATSSAKYVHYQVTNSTGKGKGKLTFSYKFGEKINESQTVGEPADMAAVATPPLQSYPYSYQNPHQYPAVGEQVHGSAYNYQPAPYQYQSVQASVSLYDYVIPRQSIPGPNYATCQQLIQEVYPPPSQGGYSYPHQWQPTPIYPPQCEPRYEYSGDGYMGYGQHYYK